VALAMVGTLVATSAALALQLNAQTAARRPMKLGVDADNWSGQIAHKDFETSLKSMQIDFISWHINPAEEQSPDRLNGIVEFCRRNHWSYLFNNEIANVSRDEPVFRHPDGTYRYDLAERTLLQLKDDPLFLGVVYDEADVLQALNGVTAGKTLVEPYFVDTRTLSPADAFLAVARKVQELQERYAKYGKRLIFEMAFPDYPFAFARGGGLLAPKLLKENYNDLMYDVYRGAALEYNSNELWACIDLWFLDKFPASGKTAPGGHTPEELLEALQFAFLKGFDFVYIEQAKALMTEGFALTPYGRKVIEFQSWRSNRQQGNWRTAPVAYYVKRFPDGYWGQDYGTFHPDHPYGSWAGNPYRQADRLWLKTLHDLSHGAVPPDADNWNATGNPEFKANSYKSLAGLPDMVVFDHFGVIPPSTTAKVLDLTAIGADAPRDTRHH
jgi:hypothetical protein